MLLDRARQHVGQEDPLLVEAHRRVRRHFGDFGLGLVALDHLGGDVAHAGGEALGIEELSCDRIDVVEEVHVALEGLDQLVDLAVARAMTDQRVELQAGFLGLAQEERDVGIVAGVEDDVGPCAAKLRDEGRKVGRGRRVTFLVRDPDAELLALGLVAGGNTGAVRAVLIKDGNADVLRILAELGLGILGDEAA